MEKEAGLRTGLKVYKGFRRLGLSRRKSLRGVLTLRKLKNQIKKGLKKIPQAIGM